MAAIIKPWLITVAAVFVGVKLAAMFTVPGLDRKAA